MEVIIARHCVAQGKDGLSPLQSELIGHPRPIRIAHAPTGAGKSYAFLEAVARGQRVLLMVPTRRLARNLAATLIHELGRRGGWTRQKAENAVAFWSSEQRLDLRAQGSTISIAGIRLNQMEGLTPLGEGELIVAIPETVSHLLAQRRLEVDQSGKGVFDLLDAFDHIVFDEFHTIEARGFGLAGVLSRLASLGFGRAKVSFLSATPIDLSKAFEAMEVPPEAIASLKETLTEEGRPLHGDVVLRWSQSPSMRDLVSTFEASIVSEIKAHRQVVIIYDALAALERDLHALAVRFRELGIDPKRVLVINSIRDSASDGTLPCGFDSGRCKDPDQYDVLIATASVEMGITFRDARMLLMEPGFAPMNFLQRYGRAARRGAEGQVVVRADEAKMDPQPWLRRLYRWIEEHDGQRMGIEELTGVLSTEVEGRFGELPKPASACAGLYWQILLDHPSNRGPRRQHLLQAQPKVSKAIHALLQEVLSLEQENDFHPHVRRWIELFKNQALDLRGIGPRITVIQEDGSLIDVDEVWLKRETLILDRFPLDQGGRQVRIRGFLDDWFREEKDRHAKRLWKAYFPHTGKTATLTWGEGMVRAWCQKLKDIDPHAMAWETHPEAMKAAEKLVQWTGLVPGHDPDVSLDTQHGIL